MLARSLAVAGILLFFSVPQAAANVLVRIDKSSQRMTVSVDGAQRYSWAVSTGRAGFGTPNGTFRAQWMARRYFSKKYYNSPMPHSIFFHRGYAIHGTNYIRRLGGTASHGCVRLHPSNAATLFALVSRHGMARTRIVVTGGSPRAIARKKRPARAAADRPVYARPAPAPSYRMAPEVPRYYVPDGAYGAPYGEY
jgi:hypothetical protein